MFKKIAEWNSKISSKIEKGKEESEALWNQEEEHNNKGENHAIEKVSEVIRSANDNILIYSNELDEKIYDKGIILEDIEEAMLYRGVYVKAVLLSRNKKILKGKFYKMLSNHKDSVNIKFLEEDSSQIPKQDTRCFIISDNFKYRRRDVLDKKNKYKAKVGTVREERDKLINRFNKYYYDKCN